jgi:FkbM family methyltransferase
MLEYLSSCFLRQYYLTFDHPFKQRIWKTIYQYLNNPRIVFPYSYHHRLALDPNDLVDRTIIESGSYEKEVYDSLMAYVLPGDVVWDIGAHIGSFSVLAESNPLVKAVYCFEPCSKTFSALEKNNHLNGNRLILKHYGLGIQEGILTSFERYQANTGGNILIPMNSEKGEKVSVSTIDNQIFHQRLDAPQLIKIDVEGMELDVLKGGIKTLRQFPARAIAFEARPRLNGELANDELSSFLKELNYEVRHIPRPSGIIDEVENFLAVHHHFRHKIPARL